jgi:hypothetical protein
MNAPHYTDYLCDGRLRRGSFDICKIRSPAADSADA